ncbi:MAG: hypothetical protein IJ467_03210 [Bacteroidaceae bacterium]|nr:hypothetical protein [Bacteroidaceae bacterium]
MIISAIHTVQADAERLQSMVAGYSEEWNDSVSEKVYSAISTLASEMGTLSSQLSTYSNIILRIEEELEQLAGY